MSEVINRPYREATRNTREMIGARQSRATWLALSCTLIWALFVMWLQVQGIRSAAAGLVLLAYLGGLVVVGTWLRVARQHFLKQPARVKALIQIREEADKNPYLKLYLRALIDISPHPTKAQIDNWNKKKHIWARGPDAYIGT